MLVSKSDGRRTDERRNIVLGIKVSPTVKEGLRRLTAMTSDELGFKVSQGQALEKLVVDALREREKERLA